ncbi:hypothetical protein FSP39_012973 [Pinctada imbricata]|uniref:Uncharacterized protein n=1 Tax=Pinctada imbricata TaxID=66713 RepID=A0AA88YTG6_PINIB|nr:hypothetical protein FSP39_012973 [Pinctada imbricata]
MSWRGYGGGRGQRGHGRGRGRGRGQQYRDYGDEGQGRDHGGGGRPPLGLRGKDLGLWFAKRSKAKKEIEEIQKVR